MLVSVPNWEAFLRAAEQSSLSEINLLDLKTGDQLFVVTAHTCYIFKVTASSKAELSTNRLDRPTGLVQLNGCTFGASATIKPNRVFCGGNLEFTVQNDRTLFTTTKILALQLAQDCSIS
jgi:hypothetical protein